MSNKRLSPDERNPFQVAVIFPQARIDDLQRVAEERNDYKMKMGINRNDHVAQTANIDRTFTNTAGLVGEYAVGSLLGLDIDRTLRAEGDKSKDFELYGVTIEVKTSATGMLLFNNLDHFRADVAVLVCYDRNDLKTVWIQGFITRSDFIKEHEAIDFKVGRRLRVLPRNLVPFQSLKMYCLMLRSQRYILERIPQ